MSELFTYEIFPYLDESTVFDPKNSYGEFVLLDWPTDKLSVQSAKEALREHMETFIPEEYRRGVIYLVNDNPVPDLGGMHTTVAWKYSPRNMLPAYWGSMVS